MRIRTLSVLTLMALALAAAPVLAGRHHDAAGSRRVHHHQAQAHAHADGMESDWDGDTLVLKDAAGSGDSVALTPDGGLTVNGDTVPLDGCGRRLVQDFYGGYVRIEEEAAVLGAEGAKLGVAGAAIAARALAGVVRLSRDDYDQDDLEREMEAEGARMEARGAELGKRGEAIESLVDDLRGTVAALRATVPALAGLAWFRMDGDGESVDGE
ncbi:MAG: hypothetical protein ACYDIE_06415 [Candidatus Krumholzibacteriia bacterium]